MDELTQILTDATGFIGEGYFHLNIAGGIPIYRERVYCYELYHQMRTRWPKDSAFYLNGEIDKSKHPFFEQLKFKNQKPDLLVHQQGVMAHNYAIVEVKSSEASSRGIKSDLTKLSFFVKEVNYQRAIYLIFGDEADEVVDKVQAMALRFQGLADIELWSHPKVGAPAACVKILR